MAENPNQNYEQEKQVNAPPTVDRSGRRLYIYPERRDGPHISRRKAIAIGLILFYFLSPWMQFLGRPLLRIDVMSQTAYAFGLVFPMSEFNFIFFVFAFLGLVLFLVTSLRGRIWCGYACPQTVFIEWVIRPIEELIEGSALTRRKQDQKGLTPKVFAKKFVKNVIFLGVALVLANSFLGFFVDPYLVLSWITSPPALHPTAFAFVMLLTALMYFDLGWFREQFCSFLCPYARFQSVLLDDNSPSVTYDLKRGEPRGRGEDKGDCIDCGLCQRVCPTGIDIRNGLQLECIQCERCIDACDSVMLNLKRDPKLITIASPNSLKHGNSPMWKNPRVYIYAALIGGILLFGAFRYLDREAIKLTVLRQPGTSYSSLPDGRLSNLFTLRAINTTSSSQTLRIELASSTEHVELICPSCGMEIKPYAEIVTPLVVVFKAKDKIKQITVRNQPDGKEHLLPIIGKN
jgi:cytochrome c oxidase accessory protein FixG